MLKRGSFTKLLKPSNKMWHKAVTPTPLVSPPVVHEDKPYVDPKPVLSRHEYEDIKSQSDGVAFRMIIEKVTGKDPFEVFNDHNHNKGTKRLKAYNFMISALEEDKIVRECHRVFGDRMIEQGRSREFVCGMRCVGGDLFIRLKIAK